MLPRGTSGFVALGLAAALLAVLPLIVPPYYVELGTYALISAMLALSLQLLVGCTGLVSLGHAAFYGLAAYTVYLVTPASHGLSILVTLPAGRGGRRAGGARRRRPVAAHARLLLPDGDAGLRADAVLPVPRHQARRRHRRRLPGAARAVDFRLAAAADPAPAPLRRLLRLARACWSAMYLGPGAASCARCSGACWRASASTSTACRRWASTPTATSSRPS